MEGTGERYLQSSGRADIWVEETGPPDCPSHARHSPNKPPVTDIRVWLECFGQMAAVLVTRFPEKAPEFWAYQSTILKAAHNYEGGSWVAYDRQYRREMLAKKDLNWSSPNARLYSEAFTGRAKAIPRCPHCLSEDHAAGYCPFNPNPQGNMGWPSGSLPVTPLLSNSATPICRNFNENRCRFSRCRFLHICLECNGPHPAILCASRTGPLGKAPANRGGRSGLKSRPAPYPPSRI